MRCEGCVYRIAGYFRGVYISRTANSILVRESNFTNGDTEPRLLHINFFFHNFNFRGLAVLSRNTVCCPTLTSPGYSWMGSP